MNYMEINKEFKEIIERKVSSNILLTSSTMDHSELVSNAEQLIMDNFDPEKDVIYRTSFNKNTGVEDFLMEYHIVNRDRGTLTYKVMMNACIYAYNNPDSKVFVFIEGLNRCNADDVLGAVYCAMDDRGSRIMIDSSNSIVVSKNVVIVATVDNSTDCIYELSEGLLERFHNIEID